MFMVSLFEVCLSEFNIKKDEFLFDWTLPQVALIVEARLERDERARVDSKSPRDERGKKLTIEDVVREMNGQ